MGEAAKKLVLGTNGAKDPTRTISLRNKWAADATRRLNELKKAIKVAVVDMDVLGLKGREPIVNLDTPDKAKFEFRRDDEKIMEFMVWAKEQEAKGILEVTTGPGGEEYPWTNMYVRSAYQKGLSDSHARLRAAGATLPANPIGIPGKSEVLGAFYTPFHADRVQLMYRRTWTDLNGVTDAMNTQMARVMAQGILEGIGPMEMAKRLTDRVDKIGITRARLIARTETVETHSRAALGEYARAEAVMGKEVKVEWWTALDERVRSSHAARHGVIYTREKAETLIGEPNCRCSLLPYIKEED